MPRVYGAQERLISGDMDTDIHDIELRISVKGIFEQVGASDKSANELWLDLMGNASVTFNSDTDSSTTYTVIPDISHSPKFVDTTKGTYKESVELKLISLSTYQETDATISGVAGFRPHIGG